MKIFTFLLVILITSCGIQNKEDKSLSSFDQGIQFLNNKDWDSAINKFELLYNKDRDDKKIKHYLALAYAGCSRYSAKSFYNLINKIGDVSYDEESSFLENLTFLSELVPVLSDKELSCLNKAVALYPDTEK